MLNNRARQFIARNPLFSFVANFGMQFSWRKRIFRVLPVWSSPGGWGIAYWTRYSVGLHLSLFWYRSLDWLDWNSYRDWGRRDWLQPSEVQGGVATTTVGPTRWGGRGWKGLLR